MSCVNSSVPSTTIRKRLPLGILETSSGSRRSLRGTGTAALSSVNPSLSIPADALKNASKKSPCAWKTKTKWPCQADHGESALPVGGGSRLPGHRAGGCSGRGPGSPGCVTGCDAGVGLRSLRLSERIFRLMKGGGQAAAILGSGWGRHDQAFAGQGSDGPDEAATCRYRTATSSLSDLTVLGNFR
jgi:hypothetical protein